LNSMSNLSLYSLLDGEPYAIQAYGTFYDERVVPLGMHIALPVTVTLALEDLDNMESDQIYLEDAYLGIYHDLQSGGYQFEGVPGLYTDRFFLHFSPMTVTGIEESTGTTFGAVVSNDVLIVSSKDDLMGSIEVMDMSGRVIFSRANVQLNQTGTKIDMTSASDGVYIVRFVGSEETLSKKVLK